MNLTLSDSFLGRQRTRQWIPLATQQFRLRHVYQIVGLNLPQLSKKEMHYFTLHLTSMSAPFYTSEKIESTNPKWKEFDQRTLTNLSAKAVVIRVWQHNINDTDSIVTTWGVNLSGLVYVGNKLSEIQPPYFAPNTVIFNIRGGFFTSHSVINRSGSQQPPFLDNLNLMKAENDGEKLFRKTSVWTLTSDVRDSYKIDKLRRLQSLQVSIRNKRLDVQSVRERIEVEYGSQDSETESLPVTSHTSSPSKNIRYAPQLLTMKSVNKMLEDKPTKVQRRKIVKIQKEIEVAQFKCKLLSQERDKKSALIRRFKNKLKELIDQNEEKNSELMDNYYQLNREIENLKEKRKSIAQQHELFLTLHSQLHYRRKQLLQELLFIYPVQQQAEKKYAIHGFYLPTSDLLSDYFDPGISVALGYVTHILIMCSTFLQVPLRYPMVHYGSRSSIIDHASSHLLDKEREFPLFMKGKERIQFTYAVYLLNRNIAQLRWLFFMHTPELKATLPNLLTFLEGKEWKEPIPLITCSLGLKSGTDLLKPEEYIRLIEEKYQESSTKHSKMYRSCESGPGLSEILAVPEAFMNKQISSESFKNFVTWKNSVSNQLRVSTAIKETSADESISNCDNYEAIEQGTDLLDPSINLSDLDGSAVPVESKPVNGKSEPVGDGKSKTDCADQFLKSRSNNELTTTDCLNKQPLSCEESTLRKVPASIVQSIDSPLTVRTDALLNTKSFNLVKSKPSM